MTGAEHFAEADRLLNGQLDYDRSHLPPTRSEIERAHVHATLALAAAVAWQKGPQIGDGLPWYGASS